MGGSGVAARQRRRGSAMATGGWTKFAWDMALFIGVLDRIVDYKNPTNFLVSIELYLTKTQKKSRRG
jgi:hypothetical protein